MKKTEQDNCLCNILNCNEYCKTTQSCDNIYMFKELRKRGLINISRRNFLDTFFNYSKTNKRRFVIINNTLLEYCEFYTRIKLLHKYFGL